MLVIGIFGSYQTAQAAEIVAGYTALEIIEGILLSFGISVFTADMVTTLTEDPSTAQDEYWRETQAAAWAEYMEAVYEDERKKGGGGSGPTPTPGISGTDIPSFKEVIQNMKDTGKIVLGAAAGAGVWECMSKAVSGLWDNLMNNTAPTTDLKGNTLFSNKLIGQFETNLDFYPSGDNSQLVYKHSKHYLYSITDQEPVINLTTFTNEKGSFIQTYALNCGLYSVYEDALGKGDNVQKRNGFLSTDQSSISNCYNATANFTIYVPYTLNGENHSADVKPDDKSVIWVHPDLQDIYKNNGKLEYPQQAPQPLQIPSIAQLTDLANKLKTNPQQAPNSVQELIDLLKQNPQPQPTVAPNPNPDPNPNPNPEVSPKPDDTDTDTDVNPDDYKADLRLVFPFCIPFDLIHLIQAFEAEPEAPVFEFPLDLELENPWTGKKILDYHHTFELDMSDYEPVIKIFRIFEIIFFIIGLLMITRQQMIKG